MRAGILAAAYAITAFVVLPNDTPPFAAGLLFALASCLVWLSCVDLARYVVPDLSTLSVAFLGTLYVGLHDGLHALLLSAGFAVCLTALFWIAGGILYRRLGEEGLGIGDAKLIGAAALWVGPSQIPMLLLISASGGIAAALLATGKAARRVPYAPFLSFALFLLVLHGMAT